MSPYYLSGGEKQLLSFIRAMIKPSTVIFADEPWANMDKNLIEFVENQLYLYIQNKDLFSNIRNKSSKSNMVIVISHIHQHKFNHEKVIIDDGWRRIIPVINNKGNIVNNTDFLQIDKYDLIDNKGD